MPLNESVNVHVYRDERGRPVRIEHAEQPFRAESTQDAFADKLAANVAVQPRELADQYLHEVLGLLELAEPALAALDAQPTRALNNASSQLRPSEEKSLAGSHTVGYVQTYGGIPVWGAGVAVQLDEEPMQIVGSTSTMEHDVHVQPPPADAPFTPERITEDDVVRLVRWDPARGQLRLFRTDPYIYRYDPEQRVILRPAGGPDPEDLEVCLPTLPIPDVAPSIAAQAFYVVTEAHFATRFGEPDATNWSALIEVATGSILRLRPLVACITHGFVYERDPITRSGNAAALPTASTAVLDGFRDDVELVGLTAPAEDGQPQLLRGEFVQVVNVAAPNPVIPSAVHPTRFDYTVPSDDFGAVCAYHNCDRLFRFVQDLGIDVRAYFNNTVFPVRVDHRVMFPDAFGIPTSNSMNASAPGNGFGNGSDGFRFALAAVNTSVCMAADWRVVLHEFGHALLWDHVNSPNFRIAHSAGDALAAILNHPGNLAERGRTFPWVAIRRRHDRTPQHGWGWGGPNDAAFTSTDPAGYKAEEVLASTLFRIYLAAGGASADVEEQRFAAHYVAFLIVKTIGLLTPATNPSTPEALAGLMVQADVGTFRYEGQVHPSGTLRKIIRWGFEQQGAFQVPGTPRPHMQPGSPPPVDVYVDDGRQGSYDPTLPLNAAFGLWTRDLADADPQHQPPQVGQESQVYVRIGNRGVNTASNIRVSLFATASNNPHWPTDWESVDMLAPGAVAALPAGGGAIVGPLSWTPDSLPARLLVEVSADGDSSHLSRFSTARPAPTGRLVQQDNNLSTRLF